MLFVEGPVRLMRVASPSLAVDLPTVRHRVDEGHSGRHVVAMCGDGQIAPDQLFQKGNLLQRGDLQGGTQPRTGQTVALARIAGDVLVPITEARDVVAESVLPERRRDLLGIPNDRVLDPTLRIRCGPPGRKPIGISLSERQRGGMLVLEEAGVEAHETDGDFESRSGCHPPAAIPLLHEHPPARCVGDRRANHLSCKSREAERESEGREPDEDARSSARHSDPPMVVKRHL